MSTKLNPRLAEIALIAYDTALIEDVNDRVGALNLAIIAVLENIHVSILGARMVLENKSKAAEGCLQQALFQPNRTHLAGMKYGMDEAISYINEVYEKTLYYEG